MDEQARRFPEKKLEGEEKTIFDDGNCCYCLEALGMKVFSSHKQSERGLLLVLARCMQY